MGVILKLRLLRLKESWYIYLIMMGMVFFLSFIFGSSGMGSNFKYPVYVVDEDVTEHSQTMVDELTSNSSFVFTVGTKNEGIESVEAGDSLCMVIIESGFAKSIDNDEAPKIGIINTKDSMEAFQLRSVVSSASTKSINAVKLVELIHGYIDDDNHKEIKTNVLTKLRNSWTYKVPVKVTSETLAAEKSFDYNSTTHIGFTVMFSMFTFIIAVGSILQDKKYGTWQRQKISPLTNAQMIGGNMLFAFLIGFIQVMLLVIVGKYVFGMNWGNDMPALIILIAALVFCGVCLGLMMVSLVKTYEQLTSLNPVILVSTSMLGGCMWPLEIINSKLLLNLANITPQKWAVQGLKEIIAYGGGVSDIVLPTGILILMGIVFFSIGTRGRYLVPPE